MATIKTSKETPTKPTQPNPLVPKPKKARKPRKPKPNPTNSKIINGKEYYYCNGFYGWWPAEEFTKDPRYSDAYLNKNTPKTEKQKKDTPKSSKALSDPISADKKANIKAFYDKQKL